MLDPVKKAMNIFGPKGTGFFDRNDFFKLLIFEPKNPYFPEPKYVLKRLLFNILKNKCSLQNTNKENCEIICCWWGFVFATLASHLHRHTICISKTLFLIGWVICLKSIISCLLVKKAICKSNSSTILNGWLIISLGLSSLYFRA